ncbi:M48 family metallopeptidase [Candidatus Pacearchaeota archaeon]|nr:M48 family metallopeptidase [Candidatus Pacearchaeota archaeon]
MTRERGEARLSFHEQISSNKRKSLVLVASILLVLILIGYVISFAFDPGFFFVIMVLSIIISISYTIFGYYNSDRIAIASAGAWLADATHYREYHNIIEGLCLASGLPKPKLYVMHGSQINAFATGRDWNHAAVCVTEGALQKLSKHELEGVLAHELSHVANYDVRFMTLSAILIGMIAIISEMFLRSLWFGGGGGRGGGRDDSRSGAILMLIGIVLAILAPIAANLVGLAISRKREYTADASGVKFVRSPTGLRNALIKIKNEGEGNKLKVSKAIAPLFMSDPLKKRVSGLFQTHPPLEKRIAILERM